MTKIYLVTNDSIKGIKIGKTNQTIAQRMKELHNTSVPAPFKCSYAVEIHDEKTASRIEKKIHAGLDDYRVSKNREYFDIKPELAKAILEIIELMGGTNVTNEVSSERKVKSSPKNKQPKISERKKKREQFRFSMLGIKVGTKLHFKNKKNITCTVANDTAVIFRRMQMTLTQAAAIVLMEKGLSGSVAGPTMWCLNGKTLHNLRLEKE